MSENKDWFTEMEVDKYTGRLVKLALEIATDAETNNKEYFIGGGLAIDFSLGKITRNHHDIDFHPMIEDAKWWIKWFKTKDYIIRKRRDKQFSETWNVYDNSGEAIVDMWPFKLVGGELQIMNNGKYSNSSRKWAETKAVSFMGINVKVENPERVLEQKTRHSNKTGVKRKQDEHDFRLLGKELILGKLE